MIGVVRPSRKISLWSTGPPSSNAPPLRGRPNGRSWSSSSTRFLSVPSRSSMTNLLSALAMSTSAGDGDRHSVHHVDLDRRPGRVDLPPWTERQASERRERVREAKRLVGVHVHLVLVDEPARRRVVHASDVHAEEALARRPGPTQRSEVGGDV